MKYLAWVILVALVFFRFLTNQPNYQNEQKVRVTGTVTFEPTVSTFRQRIVVNGFKIYLPRYPEIFYGDKVVVEGVVNDREIVGAKLVRIETSNNFLINFKRKLIDFWQSILPEPDASLVAGIVLGYKSSLPKNFAEALKKTGTTHVVVASGMNVTFVATFLLAILTKLTTRPRALVFSLLGITGYCLITGFEAPIVRAAIMAGVGALAQLKGRTTESIRTVSLTGLVMLVIKPEWLTDLGFILSFAATVSLILFETKINTKLGFVPGFFRESIATSLSAQIGTAPILFATFGQFNILSPVINGMVLWIIPPVMLIGSLGGLVGLVLPAIGKLTLYLLYPLTGWFIWTVQTFAKI